MLREKAKGPGYLQIFHKQDDLLAEMVADFMRGKPAHWPVVSRQLLHRIWSDFVRDGYVRDERALDSIYASIRDNVARLKIANIVSGHDVISPSDILDDRLSAHEHEPFCDWLINSERGWRISDYGIEPLTDAVALAFEARTAAGRLKYLDLALHVTHMRGDLSMLFVEGGRTSIEVSEEDVASSALAHHAAEAAELARSQTRANHRPV